MRLWGKSSLLLSLVCVTLLGCGFKLRGDYGLPSGIEYLQLKAAHNNSPLHRILTKALQGFDIQLWENSALQANLDKQPDASIYLQSEKLERRLLSLFSNGQVAEYELVYTVNYQMQFPEQEPQIMSFDVTREYQDDPNAVLAKSRELDLIHSEMRMEAANRIIRQLASSYVNWQQTTAN
ncbi:LPS-assembly lipoprotein LptE [Paraglaciecola aestuariivivens]